MNQILSKAKTLLRDTVRTSCDLFKIMVPVSIVTKLLKEAGVVDRVGAALGPLMEMVGLPGTMGLVWATALIVGVYSAMVVFAALAPEVHLTVAQVTVLTTMILVAHALPVELRITQKAGPRIRTMAVLRLAGALVIGWTLHRIYTWGSLLQERSTAIWNPPPQDSTWLAWAQGEVRNLCSIFLIILVLLFFLRALTRLGVTSLLTRLLEPLLTSLGMSKDVAPLTIIGMTLGIGYGGGLIIQEVKLGALQKRDVFFSVALMSLSHSLIEDTLLMMVLGGHVSGVLWARLMFSFAVVFVLVRVLRRVSEEAFDRYFFRATAGTL